MLWAVCGGYIFTIFIFITFVVFDCVSNLYYNDTSISLQNNIIRYYDYMTQLCLHLKQLEKVFNNYKSRVGCNYNNYGWDQMELKSIYHNINHLLQTECKIFDKNKINRRANKDSIDQFVNLILIPKIESVELILKKLEQMGMNLSIHQKLQEIRTRYASMIKLKNLNFQNKINNKPNATTKNKKSCFSSIWQSVIHFVFFHFVGVLWTRDSLVSKPLHHIEHRLVEDLIGLLLVICFAIIFDFDCDYNLCSSYQIRNIYSNQYVEFISIVCVGCLVLSNMTILCLLLWNNNVFITVDDTIKLFVSLPKDQGWHHLLGLLNKVNINNNQLYMYNYSSGDGNTIGSPRSTTGVSVSVDGQSTNSYAVGRVNSSGININTLEKQFSEIVVNHRNISEKSVHGHSSTHEIRHKTGGYVIDAYKPATTLALKKQMVVNSDEYSHHVWYSYYSENVYNTDFDERIDGMEVEFKHNREFQEIHTNETKEHIHSSFAKHGKDISVLERESKASISTPEPAPFDPEHDHVMNWTVVSDATSNYNYYDEAYGNSVASANIQTHRTPFVNVSHEEIENKVNQNVSHAEIYSHNGGQHTRTPSLSSQGHDSVAKIMEMASGTPSNRSSDSEIGRMSVSMSVSANSYHV